MEGLTLGNTEEDIFRRPYSACVRSEDQASVLAPARGVLLFRRARATSPLNPGSWALLTRMMLRPPKM